MIIKALNFKFDYVLKNMVEPEMEDNKGNSAPVVKEVQEKNKCIDSEVLGKFKGKEEILNKFLSLCKN